MVRVQHLDKEWDIPNSSTRSKGIYPATFNNYPTKWASASPPTEDKLRARFFREYTIPQEKIEIDD